MAYGAVIAAELVGVGVALGFGRTGLAVGLLGAVAVPMLLQARPGPRTYLLGAILPIYAVGPLVPSGFQAARLLLLGILVASDIMDHRLAGYGMPNGKWWLYGGCLGAAAAVHVSASGVYLAIGFIAVALIGSRIGSDLELCEKLFIGYRIGVFLSSLAVLASAAGLNGLSHDTQAAGYGGLSYRSTAFSYTAALALVLWHAANGTDRRARRPFLAWAGEGAVVGAALLASGGRGGLVALMAAVVVLPLVAGNLARAVRVIAACAMGLAIASWLGLSLLSVDRLVPTEPDARINVTDQYGSGRVDLYKANLRLARQNLLVGSGFDAAGLRGFGAPSQPVDAGGRPSVAGQSSPHILLLAMVVAGGLALGVAALLVLADAGLKAYRSAVHKVHGLSWASGGVVVILVTGLLENGGGLVGLESILVFSCLVRALSGQLHSGVESSEVRVESPDAPQSQGHVSPSGA